MFLLTVRQGVLVMTVAAAKVGLVIVFAVNALVVASILTVCANHSNYTGNR